MELVNHMSVTGQFITLFKVSLFWPGSDNPSLLAGQVNNTTIESNTSPVLNGENGEKTFNLAPTEAPVDAKSNTDISGNYCSLNYSYKSTGSFYPASSVYLYGG